jgi:hypothetical protein
MGLTQISIPRSPRRIDAFQLAKHLKSDAVESLTFETSPFLRTE